ncbi:MAG: hypothetical protein CSH49_07355 [Alcanivorax sp.]|nr:MAG: glutathione S-transferase family protein [Ketobacter sp. GenoA1]RLT94872.1 MAG: glutathione S-transferase family protein [Ketobacter sp.]TNC89439.1 MAG: hypothetical protein CSH49_07355 [Alcanivorax sp.]
MSAADRSWNKQQHTIPNGDQTMYTLYHAPYSQHSRRIISLLEQAGLDYKTISVNMENGDYLSDWYRAINPNHQVPTFIDDELIIYESNAVLRYLCLKHDLQAWYPHELKTRATTEQWLDWNQCLLAPCVENIVLHGVFLGAQGDPARVDLGHTQWQEREAILDSALAITPYLCGDQPTIADLSVASNIFQLGIADAEPAGSSLQRWYDAMASLQGFQKSLPK